jgi:hypothetical protein
MNPTDSLTIKERLTELADALGSKPPAEAGVKAWYIALKDFPLDEVLGALDTWLRTKAKMPAPSEIRAILAARLSDRMERQSAADKAEFAAGASKILQRMGNQEVARFHLAKIHETLRSFRSQPHDPLRWAGALKSKETAGEKLELCQSRAWRQALGNTVTEAEIEAIAERAAIQAEP